MEIKFLPFLSGSSTSLLNFSPNNSPNLTILIPTVSTISGLGLFTLWLFIAAMPTMNNSQPKSQILANSFIVCILLLSAAS